jgi:MFS family permease
LGFSDFDSVWVYDLAKWAVCSLSVYLGVYLWKRDLRRSLIPLAVVAVAFNPIAPVRFDDDAWKVVGWIAAGVFLGYAFNLGWIGDRYSKWKEYRQGVREAKKVKEVGTTTTILVLLAVFATWAAIFISIFQRHSKPAENPSREFHPVNGTIRSTDRFENFDSNGYRISKPDGWD